MAKNNLTSNTNLLSPVGFKLTINRQKYANTEYFITNFSIPEITAGEVQMNFRGGISYQTSETRQFGGLSLRFAIDEDMKNFKEIYDWLIGLGYPDNFEQRANLQSALQQRNEKSGLVYSDGSMIITTAQYQPNILINFIDLYPISIGGLEFSTQSTDIEYLQGSVSFNYRKYTIDFIK